MLTWLFWVWRHWLVVFVLYFQHWYLLIVYRRFKTKDKTLNSERFYEEYLCTGRGEVCEVLLWAVLWRTVPLFLRSNLFNLQAVTQDSPTETWNKRRDHITLFSNMMWQKRNVRRIDDGSQSKTDRWRSMTLKDAVYQHGKEPSLPSRQNPVRGSGGFGRMYLSRAHCLSNRSAAILMRTTSDRRTDGWTANHSQARRNHRHLSVLRCQNKSMSCEWA